MTSDSKGSIVIEALILAPVLFLVATFVLFAARLTDAKSTVHRAADIAARIASQSSTSNAVSRAHESAVLATTSMHSGCLKPTVYVRRINVRNEVHYSVRVSCIVDVNGLGLLSLGKRTVSSTSSEIVDMYTSR